MKSARMLAAMGLMAVAAAACGGGGTAAPATPTDVQLVLDFLPGGVHSGIYAAREEGYFEEQNLTVDIQSPTSTADTLRLVVAGQSTFGIAPIADVAGLRAEGEQIQVFLALVQVPLVALLSTEASGITEPAQLDGATVGVTGVPSDEAIARVILEDAGVDAGSVEFVTIGFDAVANLISGSVDAAIGFWSAEAVALELEGETPVIFRPDEHGAPAYPELVFFTSTDTVEDRPEVVRGFATALAQGYEFADENAEVAIEHLAGSADGVDVEFAAAEFENVRPHLFGPGDRFGAISDETVAEYLTWAVESGVLAAAPEDLVTREFLP